MSVGLVLKTIPQTCMGCQFNPNYDLCVAAAREIEIDPYGKSRPDCANSIIEHIIDTKEDVLELEDFLNKNMGKVKHEVQSVRHGKWKQVWG